MPNLCLPRAAVSLSGLWVAPMVRARHPFLAACLEKKDTDDGYPSSRSLSDTRLTLRACSQFPEQQCQERQMDELQTGINLTLAVLP